jgi:hypothetical protein
MHYSASWINCDMKQPLLLHNGSFTTYHGNRQARNNTETVSNQCFLCNPSRGYTTSTNRTSQSWVGGWWAQFVSCKWAVAVCEWITSVVSCQNLVMPSEDSNLAMPSEDCNLVTSSKNVKKSVMSHSFAIKRWRQLFSCRPADYWVVMHIKLFE